MRALDRLLQGWRIRAAARWIPVGASVLDVGCFQGELFETLRGRLGPSVGMDPLAAPREAAGYRILRTTFSGSLPFDDQTFDAVVMLAALEHIVDKVPLARECRRVLRPGGRAVLTVPSPVADRVIELLVAVHILDGMSLDQHHGFHPGLTPGIFLPHGFRLEHHSRFQLGLNNLFVFRAAGDVPVTVPAADDRRASPP
ncbi:MAG: methyltransferase domain-containing protein [Thermoanaerobaculaceae bacterium]|jgi:SAM-dependent methyltransferase|nr:methyltransferase domain-containing protein [Thermoanaerobaculaceae bacterium]